MPHLRFRALDSKYAAELSASLPQELAPVMQTTEDNFTFESIATDFYTAGKKSDSYPFVEVLWFARGQQVQDQSARIITERIKKLTNSVDVVVVFHALDKSAYYENGEHF